MTALPAIEDSVANLDLTPVQRAADEVAEKHLAVVLAAVSLERQAILDAVSNERAIIRADAERLIAEATDRAFERVEGQVDSQMARLIPLAIAALCGPFVLGLVAGVVVARRRA